MQSPIPLCNDAHAKQRCERSTGSLSMTSMSLGSSCHAADFNALDDGRSVGSIWLSVLKRHDVATFIKCRSNLLKLGCCAFEKAILR